MENKPRRAFLMTIQEFDIISNLATLLEEQIISKLSTTPWVDEYFRKEGEYVNDIDPKSFKER